MDAEQDLRENQRQYVDFLDDKVCCIARVTSRIHAHITCCFQEGQGLYHEKVKDMIRSHSNRLLVNINDLRRRNGTRAMK